MAERNSVVKVHKSHAGTENIKELRQRVPSHKTAGNTIMTLVTGAQMNSKRLPAPRNRPLQPVPANRDTWFERPSYVRVRPEQFFDSRVKLAAVCPETALMYAVLEDAFLCFHKQFETNQEFLASAREAEDWFFSDDSRWLFSFVSICEALGLDQQYMRKKLKHWTPSRLATAPATR